MTDHPRVHVYQPVGASQAKNHVRGFAGKERIIVDDGWGAYIHAKHEAFGGPVCWCITRFLGTKDGKGVMGPGDFGNCRLDTEHVIYTLRNLAELRPDSVALHAHLPTDTFDLRLLAAIWEHEQIEHGITLFGDDTSKDSPWHNPARYGFMLQLAAATGGRCGWEPGLRAVDGYVSPFSSIVRNPFSAGAVIGNADFFRADRRDMMRPDTYTGMKLALCITTSRDGSEDWDAMPPEKRDAVVAEFWERGIVTAWRPILTDGGKMIDDEGPSIRAWFRRRYDLWAGVERKDDKA